MMKRTTFGLINPKKARRYAAMIILATGLVLLGVGFTVKSYQARATAESIELPVEVIRNESRYERGRDKPLVHGQRRLQYRPVFQATPPSGEVVTHKSLNWKLSSPLYTEGDRVTGFYRAKTGVITTSEIRKRSEFVPTVMFLMGAIFIVFGGAVLVAFKKRDPAKE